MVPIVVTYGWHSYTANTTDTVGGSYICIQTCIHSILFSWDFGQAGRTLSPLLKAFSSGVGGRCFKVAFKTHALEMLMEGERTPTSLSGNL